MSLEKKKLQLELMRVQTAKLDLELKIDERKEEIKRLEEHIAIQAKREIELKQELEALK